MRGGLPWLQVHGYFFLEWVLSTPDSPVHLPDQNQGQPLDTGLAGRQPWQEQGLQTGEGEKK